jgi:inorganic pyrophosphatase
VQAVLYHTCAIWGKINKGTFLKEGKKIEVEDFLGKEAAINLIQECTVKDNSL